MGYRSTFVTSHCDITWPGWFREKYGKSIHFAHDFRGVIASKVEGKFYSPAVGMFGELVEDIAKVDAVQGNRWFYLAVMHEDGLIDRYSFPKDGEPVRVMQSDDPEAWRNT